MDPMTYIAVLAAIAILAVVVGLAVPARRRHLRERKDVENMFSADPDDRAWWDR